MQRIRRRKTRVRGMRMTHLEWQLIVALARESGTTPGRLIVGLAEGEKSRRAHERAAIEQAEKAGVA